MSATFTKAKYCCFTSFDYKDKPTWDETHMDYLIYQLEQCPETKKLHWQGYVEFKTDRMAKKVKELLGTYNCHLQKRKGTNVQASEYCKKNESAVTPLTRFEYGKLTLPTGPGRGSRTDLAEAEKKIIEYAKEGKNIKEIIELVPGITLKYAKNIEFLTNLFSTPKLDMPEVKLPSWCLDVDAIINKGYVKRQGIWIWSEESALYKSTYIDSLVATHGFDNILDGSSWKHSDILYAYERHKIITFNIPRQQELHQTMITILEKFTDGGNQLSTKYNSKPKSVKAVIIVTANIPPPHDLMPKRWIEFCVDTPETIRKRQQKIIE